MCESIAHLHSPSLKAHGPTAIAWDQVVRIVVAWLISPVLAGIVSSALFLSTRLFILRAPNSEHRALTLYPILVAITVFGNTVFIIYKGVGRFFNEIPIWIATLAALATSILCAVILQLTFVPYFLRPRVLREITAVGNEDDNGVSNDSKGSLVSPTSSSTTMATSRLASTLDTDVHDAGDEHQVVNSIHENAELFSPATELAFSFLQVFTAAVSSLALGSNDVANSVGPYAAILSIYQSGKLSDQAPVPEWALAFGGIGIGLGMAILGHHVIRSKSSFDAFNACK